MALNFFVAPNEEVIFPGILLDKYSIPSAYYGITTTFFVAGSIFAAGIVSNACGADSNIIINNVIVIIFVLLLLHREKHKGETDGIQTNGGQS